MRRTMGWIAVLAILACWVPGVAGAANKVAGAVLGNGGTPATGSAAGNRVLYGTAGQAAVGQSIGAQHDLCSGFWCAGGVRVLAVGDGPPGTPAPKDLAFGLPTPNPMTDRLAISLSLPKAAEVRVQVYDVAGRVAGAMHAGRLDPGTYRLEWDGTNGEGHASGPGVFFASLQVDGRRISQHRFVRLR